MFYIDVKFLKMLSCRLDGFVQKTSDLFNFRCPYCHDSQKTKGKKRGYLYRKKQNLFFYCHNCGQSTTFSKFLKYLDPSIYKEYKLETFAEKYNKVSSKSDFIFEQPVFNIKNDINLPKLNKLSNDNIAKSYVISRKIPEKFYSDLYYAEDFKEFVFSIFPQYNSNDLIDNDPRLIIPFRNEQGKLTMFQGRTLVNSKLRYITIKPNKNDIKLFGLDRVVKNKLIYIVEGPIDSLLLPNAVATADSCLEYGLNYLKDCNVILIPDNQPRNRELVKIIGNYIKKDYNVCLLPEFLPGKDINEIIMNGYSIDELQTIIKNNTFSGLMAKLEFDKWRKI